MYPRTKFAIWRLQSSANGRKDKQRQIKRRSRVAKWEIELRRVDLVNGLAASSREPANRLHTHPVFYLHFPPSEKPFHTLFYLRSTPRLNPTLPALFIKHSSASERSQSTGGRRFYWKETAFHQTLKIYYIQYILKRFLYLSQLWLFSSYFH